MRTMSSVRLIETDAFPFEFLSRLAERESWRKEVHRPIYHVHKWWATRLGSVFRGVLLGCVLPQDGDLESAFYSFHDFQRLTVFDPFMGSGTTVGEAHKLGLAALGRDINPVAFELVRVALGPVNRTHLETAFRSLSDTVGREIRSLYRTTDRDGSPAEALYYFWVMQAPCTECQVVVDLFPSYVIARNAYPQRKPEIQVYCPTCGDVFERRYGETHVRCHSGHMFEPSRGPASGASATCPHCKRTFAIISAMGGRRPSFRLYAKLVLTEDGRKQYAPVVQADLDLYAECEQKIREGSFGVPTLELEQGYNTRQAINYGFRRWRDFFNDRQLIALARLRAAIMKVDDESVRGALATLFSGVLEFNNMFASYKGEGTGAVRHMFAHHILKPERAPIEANVWGTSKSSGSFSGLYRSRLVRALNYRDAPTEVNGVEGGKGRVSSPPFTKQLSEWRVPLLPRSVALSCGDSSSTGLPDKCVDLVATDPPFFDNVHYSELADFFYSWWRLDRDQASTRQECEVQDPDPDRFAVKLRTVFKECNRVLKEDGLLVFTYHHSREEGWRAVARAVLGSGFVVVNSHPVKAEMSVATPKTQAKEPIQLDIILVCRKASESLLASTVEQAERAALEKLERLRACGFHLSTNDRRIVLYGQFLTTLRSEADFERITEVPVNQTKYLATRPLPA
jgi:putative DNA methylase